MLLKSQVRVVAGCSELQAWFMLLLMHETWAGMKESRQTSGCSNSSLLCLSCYPPLLPQVSQTQAMLANEYGTASNIKSRVNRQSVLAAITSAQQRLKLYTKVGHW